MRHNVADFIVKVSSADSAGAREVSGVARWKANVFASRLLAKSAARLSGTPGYITPKDVLAGRQHEIHAERDRKLETARQQRQSRRQQAREERSGQPPRCRMAGEVDRFRSADFSDLGLLIA